MRSIAAHFLRATRLVAAVIVVLGPPTRLASGADAASNRPSGPPADPTIDFVAEIQPLFTQHCLGCHGQDKQRSGYRLDNRSIAVGGGESGEPAILPGNSKKSRLVQMVSGELPDLRMPPKGDPLSPEQVERLRRWIDQGAPWPDTASRVLEDPLAWWSLQPLRRPEVPEPAEPQDARALRHPVDAFITARLHGSGLAPAPEADRRTLIRRLSFDLLGLPPTPEEVAAFVGDSHPQAYENLVDRLLASPHFGERWARQWLDVVHYGDTHGYDKDKPRPNAWPYRDYVIRAFNEDKAYERFVQEQIAGDVLYPDTADGIEALGFIAAGPWDLIGHEEVPESKIDGKIARHLDRDDMVANTIGTFASTTVHCAQCHDHKFDPVKQEDYYRLQAVFAAVDRADRRYYRETERNQQRSRLEREIRSLRYRENQLRDSIAKLGGDALRTANERIAHAEKAAKESQPPEYGYHSAIASRADDSKWVQVDLGKATELDRIVLRPCRDQFNNIGDGFGFPVRYRVEVSSHPDFIGNTRTIVDRTSADVPNPGLQPQAHSAAGIQGRYVRVTATRLAPRQNDFIFALAELEVVDPRGTNVAKGTTVAALDSTEAPERWRKENLTDGKAPRSGASADESFELRRQRDALVARLVPTDVLASLLSTTNRLAEARRELERMPSPLVAYVGSVHDGSGNFRGTGPDNGQPRPIHILTRGDVTKPHKAVGPGALRCVTSTVEFPTQPDHPEGERRAALARWLTDPANPLTWRSIANRIWQHHFGRGLVDTPNDFGRMGSPPSHPELLDWLAVEFRDGGQSFKSMARLLVTSATYRQSSASSHGDARAQDADNRLLARMNLRRLDAEAIRDSLLAVSGKLDRRAFGPGFQDFVIEKPEHSPHYQYHLHDAEDPRSHRRSIYRFLVRSQQEPFMVALDCADPSMRVDRRSETLTPLQALALLNSRLTVAMSRHFAQRVRSDAGDDIPAQVRRAFDLAVQRQPTTSEATDLEAYCKAHGLPATCRLLFNLNEFVYID